MRSLILRSAVSLFVLSAVAVLAAQAAPTSYVDDFSGTVHGWAPSSSYSLTQQDGTLTLVVAKEEKWTGEWLDLGGEHDFSAHPCVNLRAKTDTPCVLHVYLADGTHNDLLPRKLRAVNGYVDLCYDFSGAKNVDLKKVKGMIFTVNGAANSWSGTITFDDLRVGDAAKRLAGIEGVHDQIDYHDTGRHTVLLTGLEGASSFKVSGAEDLIRGAAVGPIQDGQAELSYECIPGATGKGTVTVTAVGAPGYADNTVSFGLTIEDNLPPTIDKPADMVAQVGVPQVVHLTGVSDGNVAAEQPLTITADGMQVAHEEGSPYATLSFAPKGAGARTVTVTLDDGAGGDSVTRTSFQVRAVPSWNKPPTIDQHPDMTLFLDNPEQRVGLTGITDGDGGGQPLALSVTSSDPSVLAASVEYGAGATARLRLLPNAPKTGTARITVSVQDKGGAPDNNGDQSTQMTFAVTTRVRPLGGWSDTFADWAKEGPRWGPEAGSMEVSQETMDSRSAVKVVCKDKITFGGLWLKVPDLDLSKDPYLTVDVKPQDDMQFNVYFYDGKQQRNDGAHQVKQILGGRWQTVTFDFSGEDQMSTSKGQPINAGWVTGVLFNFHPHLRWPFTRYSGTIYFRNVRIGADADVSKLPPQATVAEVPDQVYLTGAGRQQVTLSGIGSGSAEAATVKVSADGAPAISGLSVGAVGPDGTTPLTYEVGPQAGRATISVDVAAPGSEARKVSFDIEVLDPGQTADVSIDCAQQHQLIRGFGTFDNDLPADLYARQLGASAMRIGLIDNQVEPVNDNSDPHVLYEGALNRKVFDFAHFRALHAAGVESFILTSWSPPAWMKTNLSMNYQQANAEGNSDTATNRLDYYQYDEFAESMVGAARAFKEETGFDLAGIGLQNEPAFDEPYPSAILDPRHFVELIKVVGPRLKAAGIPAKLYMPEQVFSQPSMMDYIDALNADPLAQKYCDIVATHGYDLTGTRGQSPDFPGWTRMWQRSQQGGTAKELWMTETGFGYRGWDSALATAVTIYGGLEYGNIGLSTTWSIEGQLVSRGKPNPTFYVCSQFFRHIRPGARRVTSHSTAPEVLATSYVNDAAHGSTLVCVLINTSEAAQAVRLNVQGRPAPTQITLSRTDRVNHHAEIGAPAAGGLILLPPKSVTTVAE